MKARKSIITTLVIILLLLGSCNNSGIREEMLPLPSCALETALQVDNDPVFKPTNNFPSDWWTIFNDPQLDQFIQIALEKNPTVLLARTKIASAASQADRVRSILYPHLSWGADVAREKLSTTGVIPFEAPSQNSNGVPTTSFPVIPGTQSGIPEYFTLYETELSFVYNFDFWEKNKNLLRAALGEMQANIAESAFAKLSISIALAKVYFALQIDYQKVDNAQAIVGNRSSYCELVKRRVKANLDSNIDLGAAESNLADAMQALQLVQGDTAVHEYQLKAYLAGNFEEEIVPTGITEQVLNHVPLPRDLPLHLISRRPDIISQLWLIESAGRRIDVAKAGFYPDFNIAGFFGYQTIHFRELFKWPSSFFNVDPAVSLPIFDGGRLTADLNSSYVNYNLAILKYNELVLKAAGDVLESLVAVRSLNQQLQQYRIKMQAQEDIYGLTKKRAVHNLNSKLDELTAEFNTLSAYNQELDTLENLMQAILTLIKSIGGGYDVCYEG